MIFPALRHSFTSHLVAGGVDLRTVQELTGHKTLAMLQRYSRLMPGKARDAVKLLDD